MFKLVLVMRSTTAHFFATFSLFLLEPFLEEISGLEAYWELLCLCLKHKNMKKCMYVPKNVMIITEKNNNVLFP